MDGESEVRIVSSSVLQQVAAAVGRPTAVTEHIGPLLQHLAVDDNEQVRGTPSPPNTTIVFLVPLALFSFRSLVE